MASIQLALKKVPRYSKTPLSNHFIQAAQILDASPNSQKAFELAMKGEETKQTESKENLV